jgi:5-methyltetrahydrofolate--homocysteine methyltransferase
MSDTLKQMAEMLYQGNAPAVADLTQKALDEGLAAGQILNEGLVAGMERIGNDFREGVLFVPEVLIAARAMQSGLGILRPLLEEGDVPMAGKAVLGTVRGDLHDIGKNLVSMMLQGGGFEVVDLGADTSPQKFVDAVKAEKPDLVGMSALLTTTMLDMKRTLQALEQAGLRDSVKVMVGGAPLTQDFADEIGADGYAPDGPSAVDLARSLVGGRE